MTIRQLFAALKARLKRKQYVEINLFQTAVINIRDELAFIKSWVKSEENLRTELSAELFLLKEKIGSLIISNRHTKSTLVKHMNAINDLRDDNRELDEYKEELDKEINDVQKIFSEHERLMKELNSSNARNNKSIGSLESSIVSALNSIRKDYPKQEKLLLVEDAIKRSENLNQSIQNIQDNAESFRLLTAASIEKIKKEHASIGGISEQFRQAMGIQAKAHLHEFKQCLSNKNVT